jgi:hypothetical protein
MGFKDHVFTDTARDALAEPFTAQTEDSRSITLANVQRVQT